MSKVTHPNQRVTLHIDHLAGLGDGIAMHQGRVVFVPYSCAGEEISAILREGTGGTLRAEQVAVLTSSPQRQEAPCRHFGTCGGCRLQHLATTPYTALKQGMLAEFLHKLGVDDSVQMPMVAVGQGSRRRVEFKIQRVKGQLRIGFFAPQSHELIDLAECPVTEPRLVALLPVLRNALAALKQPGHFNAISLTQLAHGVDAVISTRAPLKTEDKSALVAMAKANGFVRLSVRVPPPEASHPSSMPVEAECLYDSGNASIHFGAVDVALPIGAFLQATQAGQEAITREVCTALQGCTQVVDCYAGCGTYSFPLLQQVERVSSFEGDAEMVAAAHNAIRQHGLQGRMSAAVRDLFRQPLTAQELQAYDGVVINPPRNGALPQAKQLAKSRVPVIAMVSCNPATFQRDARVLLDAGYRMTSAIAIDQFYWSHHLELVAVFRLA